ncbi:hypothetical protein R3P38DRAFT_2797481 [Favolaschia claudopus]|uniref:Uncharacterized protein n=1 Tax=Favolaschia claudopus TaxID=2862362 RepID=A0AAW0A277_9AGAR
MSSNGNHSVNEEVKNMNDAHYPESEWAASNFLTGPLREMPAGTRHDSLQPNPWIAQPLESLDATLTGLRTKLHNLRTNDNPVEGMESTMRELFATIRANKVDHYLEDAPALEDNSSSVAVDDHASIAASDGSEEPDRAHVDDTTSADTTSADTSSADTTSALERQFIEEMAEIDATERAWMRLMAALRKIESLKREKDTRSQLQDVLHEL